MQQIKPIFTKKDADAVHEYMLSGGWLTEHSKTKEFEDKLAKYLNVKHVVMTTSGTTALMLACESVNASTGSDVLVPVLTMVATANAPMYVGASVDIVDIDEQNCMSVESLKTKITGNTGAVIYVALNGRDSGLDEITKLCRDKGVPLIVDACQALGSPIQLGDIACFSLSPHKIISTGQGGFIATNIKELADKVRRFKDFGRDYGGMDIHDEFGINGKYTDLQAVVGLSQLENIKARVRIKRRIYSDYYKNIPELMKPLGKGTPWMVDIYSHRKRVLLGVLDGFRGMYPPLYMQKCYNTESFNITHSDNAYKAYSDGVWAPSSLDLTTEDINDICHQIKRL